MKTQGGQKKVTLTQNLTFSPRHAGAILAKKVLQGVKQHLACLFHRAIFPYLWS